MPRSIAAFRDGALSWSKLRELSRIVTPENETRWLEFALDGDHGADHVAREVTMPLRENRDLPRARDYGLPNLNTRVSLDFTLEEKRSQTSSPSAISATRSSTPESWTSREIPPVSSVGSLGFGTGCPRSRAQASSTWRSPKSTRWTPAPPPVTLDVDLVERALVHLGWSKEESETLVAAGLKMLHEQQPSAPVEFDEEDLLAFTLQKKPAPYHRPRRHGRNGVRTG